MIYSKIVLLFYNLFYFFKLKILEAIYVLSAVKTIVHKRNKKYQKELLGSTLVTNIAFFYETGPDKEKKEYLEKCKK